MERLSSTAKSYLDFVRRYPPATRPYFEEPRPLVMTRADAVFSWSAKSASTHLLMWYLAAEGLIDETFAHRSWPHHYREHVLYLKPDFRQSLARLRRSGGRGWSLIRVMRSPLNRLVSTYRHALRSGNADRHMSRILGRNISSHEGFAIATFLEFLGKIDIRTCNIHFRSQVNRIDTLGFDSKIVIDADRMDLFAELNKVESLLGLDHVDIENIDYFANIKRRHHARPSATDFPGPLFTRAFSTSDARARWPGAQLREIPEVQSGVAAIYAADYSFMSAHP